MESRIIPRPLEITQHELEPDRGGGSFRRRPRVHLDGREGFSKTRIRPLLNAVTVNTVQYRQGLVDQWEIPGLGIVLERLPLAHEREDPDDLSQLLPIDLPPCPGNQDRNPQRVVATLSQYAEFILIKHTDRQIKTTSPRGLLQARLCEFYSQTLYL